MNKPICFRTKVEAVITFIIVGSLIVVGAGAWTIKEGEDSTGQIYHGSTDLITNSNGKAYTSSLTNLQSAIYDLNSTNGGTVYIPIGTITCSDYILIPSDVTLQGYGSASILKVGNGVSGNIGAGFCLLVNYDYNGNSEGNRNITIRDLVLDGNDVLSSVAETYGSLFRHVNNTLLENVVSHNFNRTGIAFSLCGQTSGNKVLNCHTYNNSIAGVDVDTTPQLQVIGHSSHNEKAGVYIESGSEGSIVSGSSFHHNNWGIYFGCANCSAVGNTITDMYGTSLFTNSGHGIDAQVDNCIINSNYISGYMGTDSADGIYVGDHCIVTNNIINSMNNKGVYFTGDECVVTGNVIDCAIPFVDLSGNYVYDNLINSVFNSTYFQFPVWNQTTDISIGRAWYDTATHKLYIFEGSGVWKSTTFT